MQAKLLRALEEKEITRVGGHTPIKVNPRIISATHKDLQEMVDKGDFREDLFYRLNVVPIPIPPLRERGYDIIILARYFLQHFSKVYNKDLRASLPNVKTCLWVIPIQAISGNSETSSSTPPSLRRAAWWEPTISRKNDCSR